MPRGVLLVGSIPLTSAREVFEVVAHELPHRVRHIPDGETGVRKDFMEWQEHIFPEEVRAAYLRADKQPGPGPDNYTFSPSSLKSSTGYDDVAISSYHHFLALRTEGLISPDVRFQVCVPTPLNVIAGLVDPRYQALVEPHYEALLAESVSRIQDAIPAHDLAIQWDVALDVALLEFDERQIDTPKPFFSRPWFSPVRAGVVERIVRAAEQVRPRVEIGFHLCYGDKFRKHFIEPLDLALLTRLTNDVGVALASGGRSIDWIHMPVPRDRKDAAYFEPLKALHTAFEGHRFQLFLGLVHIADLDGTRERARKAAEVLGEREFGVATECGLGRTTPDELRDVLAICRAVSDEY